VDEPLSSESEFHLEEQPEMHEEYEEPASAFTESSALAEQGEHYPLERESQPAFTERFDSQPRQQKEPSWLTELGFGRGVQPEPEPTFTNFNSVSEPEPAFTNYNPEPEPEPAFTNYNPEPEPEPAFTNYNPEPEPEPAFTNYNPVPEPALQPEMPPTVAQGTQPLQKVVAREEQKYQEFQVPQPVPPVRNERSASPVPMPSFEPAPVRQEQEPQVQRAVPVNPLLDGGLETTMKRPAVRLQPMKQRMMAQELHITPVQQQKSRSTEHANQPFTEGNVSYRDRLLQGYQAQLIGDYDGAMQEYRVIIRNAPELLSEVVSNVRALLKLAPKYSAGYRVLGDAYMRQGEYLQAMEAYNKALTMAKKAKS
jgi:hypothetical protein